MKKRVGKLLKTTVKVALLVGLGVAGWYGYQGYAPAEEEDGLGELPVAIAGVNDITVSVQATGVLQPIKVVEIKSKASGEILEMPVEMGDFVEAGDLIAQIDTKTLDQELKQVQADYESAVVRLEIAESRYDRAKSLFAEDLISEGELETSQQTYTNAQGQMLRGEASLDLSKERLADATVRAPTAGTIISKVVEEGQIIASSTNNVSGGTTLVQMADLSELEIRTLVDEVDIGQVRAGLPVDSKVEAFADEQFDGAVVKIEPQAVVQQSVTTFPVLSRIDNANGKLLPGMNADVSIIVHRKPGVLTIPNEAVRTPSDAAEVRRMLGLVADEGGSRNGGREGSDGEGRGGRSSDDSNPDRSGGRGGSDAQPSGGPDLASSRDDNGRTADEDGTGELAGARSGGGDRGQGGRGDSGARGESGARGDSGGRGDSGAGDRGDGSSGDGGGRSGADMRARFASMSPAERTRAMAAMRAAADTPDRDPFGIGGRRENAVVFVYDELGQISTKDIVVGVRDWEDTEILAGLDPGDQVLLLPSTSLLRSQDRLRSWAQGRSGIPGMGGGGPPPGMGRGRGR